MSGAAPSSAAPGSSWAGMPATPTRNSLRVCAPATPGCATKSVRSSTKLVIAPHVARSVGDTILVFIDGTSRARYPFRERASAWRCPVRDLLPSGAMSGHDGATAESEAKSTARTTAKGLTTLTFFFTAAYTRSPDGALTHERRTGGQVRGDGL